MNRKKIILALTIFSLFLSVIAVAGFYSFGSSVTMNLVLHIGNSDDDDIITSSDSYIALEDSNKVIALLSKSAFGTRFEHYANDYSLEIRQPLSENRFFLVFTKGDNKTITDKIEAIDDIPQNRFGDLIYIKPSVIQLFLRLEYYGINLISKARWISGARELLLRNDGKNITIEVIR